MNALFLALLLGGLLYFLWQWDSQSRRRRAAAKGNGPRSASAGPRPASGGARPAARALPAKVGLSTWLARIAVGAVAVWLVFLVITLFRSVT